MNLLVCFVGPSGVGKTSYIKRLIEDFNFQLPIIAVTRGPRDEDGINYIYLDEPRFLKMISDRKFIEWDCFNGHYYGTFKESITQILNSSEAIGCVLDLTPKGCRQIKATIPEAIIIALLPDNMKWLKKRLFERATDSIRVIEQRTKILQNFIQEIKNLNTQIVYCNYAPETWDLTFENIISILNFKLVRRQA